MSKLYFAHSTPFEESTWELLDDHLDKVAERAAWFAAAFGSEEWGKLAGLWHDVGKYQADFQRRIHGERIQAPHAGVGAALAGVAAPPLAFAIAGHHTGLANRADQGDTSQKALTAVVAANGEALRDILPIVPDRIKQARIPPPPVWLRANDEDETKLRIEFWTRMLFSVLVDADRLATAAFSDPAKRAAISYASLTELNEHLDAELRALASETPIGKLREQVLAQCQHAALQTPGLFTLTAPTGSGKTLASMSFALRHAQHHGLRRVIVVAPYTSIIDQNASVYRDVFGSENVVEHHSAIDEDARERELPEAELKRRLAVENWDAPIVVTTAVQFFESLFSNLPSRCRKLHNVARSVVVIDEAQTMPTDFLLTVIDAIRQLTTHYGCSIVLSTATQPALAQRDALSQGLTGAREIVEEPSELAARLRRVDVRWPKPSSVTSLQQVAEEMAQRPQVLAIVHSRRDARELSSMLPAEGRYHLSKQMCGAHRAKVIAEIRTALVRGDVCRVASTQLIEAGVDVDFPAVYRAMAGLDSLAQAAGRCNRNGKLTRDGLPALGEFVVFRAETSPPSALRLGLETAELMLSADPSLNLTDPETLERYFRRFYFGSKLDKRGVMAERRSLNFATVANRVRLITEATHPLVVRYGDAMERVSTFSEALRWNPGGSRRAARALQPFVVELYEHQLQTLLRAGAAAALEGFGYVLAPTHFHLYDDCDSGVGLVIGEDPPPNPGALVI